MTLNLNYRKNSLETHLDFILRIEVDHNKAFLALPIASRWHRGQERIGGRLIEGNHRLPSYNRLGSSRVALLLFSTNA